MLDRLKPRLSVGSGVHLTEFGYQTSPPDHAIGITLTQQARYLQQAAFIAWRAQRVSSLSYYQWDDEPVIYRGRATRAYSGWQSGLRFVTGKPKPALSTFPAPFVIERRRGNASVRFWGQVRPAAQPEVTLQVRPPGEAEFRDVSRLALAADGSWTLVGPATPGASYRFRWTPVPSLTEPLPAPRDSRGGRPGARREDPDPRRRGGQPMTHAGDDPAGGRPVPRAGDDPAAFYAAGYSLADREQGLKLGRWRELGARTKAAHAVALCSPPPATVVEIGCGEGALLAALSAAWPAARFDGFELSEPAVSLARSRGFARVGRLEAFDGAHVPVEDDAYELAVLSHVLEHVPDPLPLLREAARVAPRVLVEVPLEANRSAARPAKRAEAERIGHLHAFDRADVRALLAGAGLRVEGELSDPLPREHHAFFADEHGGARAGGGEVGAAHDDLEIVAGGGREMVHGALRSDGWTQLIPRTDTNAAVAGHDGRVLGLMLTPPRRAASTRRSGGRARCSLSRSRCSPSLRTWHRRRGRSASVPARTRRSSSTQPAPATSSSTCQGGEFYCRLPRAATACDVATFLPLANGTGRAAIMDRPDGTLLIVRATSDDSPDGTLRGTSFYRVSGDRGATWSPPTPFAYGNADFTKVALAPGGQSVLTLEPRDVRWPGCRARRSPAARPARPRSMTRSRTRPLRTSRRCPTAASCRSSAT